MKLFAQLKKAIFEKVASDGTGVEGQFLYNTTDKRPRFHNGNTWTEFGGPVTQYLYPYASPNVLRDSAEEFLTTGWTTYNDASGAAPIDGEGGTATGISVSVTSDHVVNGNRAILLYKDNANRQGMGYTLSVTPASLAGKPAILSFQMKSTLDLSTLLKFSVLDADNTPIVNNVTLPTSLNLGGSYLVTYQEQITLPYFSLGFIKILFHIASTSATSMSMSVDGLSLVGLPTPPIILTAEGTMTPNTTGVLGSASLELTQGRWRIDLVVKAIDDGSASSNGAIYVIGDTNDTSLVGINTFANAEFAVSNARGGSGTVTTIYKVTELTKTIYVKSATLVNFATQVNYLLIATKI